MERRLLRQSGQHRKGARDSTEEGSVLILICVSILGVIIFSTIFGLDNVTSHKANLLAQHTADKAVFYAKDIFLVTSGYSALQTAVNTLPTDGKLIDEDARFKITKVSAFLPVISDQLPPEVNQDNLHGGPGPLSFQDFNQRFSATLNCPATVGKDDCLVYLDVESDVPQGLVPAGFWDRDQHGMHLGIAIEVESDTVFLKIQDKTRVTGKGKAFLSIRHQNENVPNGSARPSYIIGVAPQGESLRIANSSFSYPSPSPTTVPSGASASFSNPLDPFSNPQFTGFQAASPPIPGSIHNIDNIFSDTFAQSQQEMHPLDAPSNDSFRDALIAGCFTPWIAARNMFVQLLVEELSRLGSLRDTFQFGVVHSLGDDGSSTLPTMVKLSGEDSFAALSSPSSGIVLPFVNRRDVTGKLPCNFEDDPTCKAEHGWYLEQFRSCFHANSSLNSGVKSPSPFFQFYDVTESGNSFEPTHYKSMSASHDNPPHTLPYGQYTNTGLGLNQVVRFMGVEQKCVEHDTGTCERSTDTTNLTDPAKNVIPDIASFLQYAAGDTQAAAGDTQALAYHKAGPLQYQGTETNTIENEDVRTNGLRYPSDVILILNQRLSDDIPYRENIQSEVSTLNKAGRRVLVVFFARSPADEGDIDSSGKDKVFEDFQETFCVNFTGGKCAQNPPTGFLGNVVVRIAPGNIDSSFSQYTGGCNRAPGSPNDDQCFQDFYMDLLTRNNPRSIEQEAKGFMEALMFDLRVSL